MGCGGSCWALAARRPPPRQESLLKAQSNAAGPHPRAEGNINGAAPPQASREPGAKEYCHPSLHRLNPERVAQNEQRLQSALGELEGASELDLSCLDLWSVPEAVLAQSRPQLVQLNLRNNCIDELPAEISLLTGLTRLDLSRNRIRVLPESIRGLRGLRELNLMTNHLRQLEHSIPLAALKELAHLELLDLRFNPKLMSEKVPEVLAAHVPAGCSVLLGVKPTPKQLSAGERDATALRSQLEPWSTPALRRRLADEFGVETDEEVVDREEIFRLLMEAYAVMGPRRHRRLRGVPVPAESQPLLQQLFEALRSTRFPQGAKRERQQIQAQGYIILRRPLETDVDVEHKAGSTDGRDAPDALPKQRQHGMRPERPMPKLEPGKKLGWRRRTAAGKFKQHAHVWDLAQALVKAVDPEFAEIYTAIAMTKNFVGSPHVDTENVGAFYGLALGDFEGGGICVENTPFELVEVDTRHRFGKVDGRFPHWVAPYTGERYSIIYYQTAGAVAPKTTAVFNMEEVV